MTYVDPPTDSADAQERHELAAMDETHHHQACRTCNPNLQLGVPFVARCGRRAIGFAGMVYQPPANACPDCLALTDKPCSRGHTR